MDDGFPLFPDWVPRADEMHLQTQRLGAWYANLKPDSVTSEEIQ